MTHFNSKVQKKSSLNNFYKKNRLEVACMKKSSDKSAAAFQELVRILEEAVQVGATSIGIEFEDRELVV